MPADSSLYLDQLLELMGEGVVVEDDDGRVAFANPAAERLLGQAPGELLGRCWAALAPCLPPAAAEEARGCEVELHRPDGTAIPLKVSAHRFSEGDRPCGTLWLLTPAGAGELEAYLRQSAKMADLGQSALGVVHELNNALTVILLQIQLLYNLAPMLPRFQEGLANIKEQVQRVTRMNDQLLAAARAASSPQSQPSPLDELLPDPALNPLAMAESRLGASAPAAPVAPPGLFPASARPQAGPSLTDVNAAIRATLDLQMDRLQRDGIDVVLNLHPRLPATLMNPDHLQQVLINLINNAQQAVATVRRRGRLAVATTVVHSLNGRGPRIQIQISDNGPGIPHDVMLRLFRPFFTTKPPGEGTGLGLAICNRIVREHGGRIWAENNLQDGATFVVELPLPSS